MVERYSDDPFEAVREQYRTFGFLGVEVTKEVVDYRVGLLEEEGCETTDAHERRDPEKLVDGHIDVIVIALGNLAMFGVDFDKAFDEVMRRNATKVVRKRSETDPNDVSIAKPSGWINPDHSDNHGVLDEVYTTRTTEETDSPSGS